MKYLTTGIICMLLLGTHSANALNETEQKQSNKKSVFLRSGMYRSASMDELYSTSIYAGQAQLWSVGFEKHKKRLTSTIFNFSMLDRYPMDLDIYESTVRADHRLRMLDNLHFDVNDMYCFPIKLNSKDLSAYFALHWFTSFDLILNHEMMPELILSTIAPGVYAEYNLKKHSIEGSISGSLLSYSCRNNYSNVLIQDFEQISFFDFIKNNSRILFPNSLQSVFIQINYSYSLFENWSVLAGYNFRYIHNAEPRTLKSVSGLYNLGLAYKF